MKATNSCSWPPELSIFFLGIVCHLAKIQMSTRAKSKRRSFPGLDQLWTERAKRGLLRDALRQNEQRDIGFRRMILSIPPGKVSTYSAIARLLRTDPIDQLPWHHVVGVGGEIKLRGAAAYEQRARLKLEGVQFSGKRVDMERFTHLLKPWEVYG